MKKIFCFPVLLITFIASAQNFEFGVKAGVNISNFMGGDFHNVEHNALVGFHGGGLVRFKFGNNLAIQPEAVFSSQGAKLKNADVDSNYRISYINIPVLLQYQANGGFYLEAGPQFGFKVSENIPNTTIETFAKTSDLSLAMGLGYMSKIGFGIGGRYNLGLSKVGDFDASNISPDFKNSVIQFSVFYLFFHKAKTKG